MREGLENEYADAIGCPTAEWQVQTMGVEEEISGASSIPLALSSRILLPFCLGIVEISESCILLLFKLILLIPCRSHSQVKNAFLMEVASSFVSFCMFFD